MQPIGFTKFSPFFCFDARQGIRFRASLQDYNRLSTSSHAPGQLNPDSGKSCFYGNLPHRWAMPIRTISDDGHWLHGFPYPVPRRLPTLLACFPAMRLCGKGRWMLPAQTALATPAGNLSCYYHCPARMSLSSRNFLYQSPDAPRYLSSPCCSAVPLAVLPDVSLRSPSTTILVKPSESRLL